VKGVDDVLKTALRRDTKKLIEVNQISVVSIARIQESAAT
jgi:hypothetical protein